MTAGDIVVQGVDALKDSDLVFLQPERGAQAVVAHLAGELVPGNDDFLSPGQGGEVPVQQLHVQEQGGLIVDDAIGGAGGGFGVHGEKVVVHRHRPGAHTPALKLLGDFHGRGGFARPGGTGQQHDGAAVQIAQNPVRGQ